MTSATTLTNLRIWDGAGFADADAIRLQGAIITAVGDAAELGADARVIDYAGATAIPGLIDAHVHMVLDPERSTPPQRHEIPELPAMRRRAAQMLAAGITTARDLGGGHWLELELRDEIRRGATPGPRLLCAGQPVTCPQGHCHFWGGEAADADAIRAVVERQRQHDVDLIKVMATGGRMTGGSQPLQPQFSVEELEVVVSEAAAAGLQVAAHCHGSAGIAAAAAAHVHTIEHCSWLGALGWSSDYQPDVAALIARRGIWVSPTVNAGWQRMLGNATGARVSSALRAMIELEIPIVASTDAGIPGVFHHELARALGVFSQLSDTDAAFTLRTATSQAAQALGLGDITGRLAAGFAADILIADGNPLADLRVLERPLAVWARGACVVEPAG